MDEIERAAIPDEGCDPVTLPWWPRWTGCAPSWPEQGVRS